MLNAQLLSLAAGVLAMCAATPASAQAQPGDLGTDPGGPSWNYKPGATGGPEQWGSLYPGCATSTSNPQSPINIRVITRKAPPIPVNLAAAYASTSATVKPSHFTNALQFSGAATNTLTAGTTAATIRYDLIGIHAHSPSEHWVGNKPFDAELHLVHQAAGGQFAVIAIMLTTAGKGSNAAINDILALNASSGAVTVNPANLLPSGYESKFYTYVGSLTTPPCTTGVVFYVLKTPQKVSKDAIKALQTTVQAASSAASAPIGGYASNNRVPLMNSEGRVPFSMPAK